MAVAIVTGASRGLGEALAGGLADRGWSLVICARGATELAGAEEELRARLAPGSELVAIAGDVADGAHRRALVEASVRCGGLDLLVNNASVLGAVPLTPLSAYPLEALRAAYEVNAVAPLALLQEALPRLRRSAAPRVLDITSDAASEAYRGWGGYGSSKAALEQLGAVVAVEEPDVRIWSVDPGDLRTRLHQEAYPGEDISDRPPPSTVVPALLGLIESDRPSGRFRVAELLEATAPIEEAS